MEKIFEVRVPGGYARAFEAKKGQLLKIIDIEGQQVADFIAFNKENLKEKLSPSHTYIKILSLNIKPGDIMRSNLRNPMFEIIEDTGKNHDLLMPACDERRYLVDYGIENHRSCVQNFEEVLEKYNLNRDDFANPVNLFQKTRITEDGKLIQETGASKPGDYIVFKCLQDIIGAISACPMDVNPIGGDKITDILVQIFDNE
ncbi:MAG TPA: urea carboxylase-associated family protein [Clostridia bacterium]|nr:urea carboxylase-associated family protein [Clostridia bacterium]